MKNGFLIASASILALVTATSAFEQAADKDTPPKSSTGKQSDTDIVVTGRYIATGAMSATKQNVSTLDTPFSVSA